MAKKAKATDAAAAKRRRSQASEVWGRLKKNKGAMVGLFIVTVLVLIAIFADVMFDFDTDIAASNLMERLQKPNAKHWFGTDEMGRDLFARVVYGTRYSVAIGAAAVLFSVVIGVPYGAITGYFGGKVDLFLSRIMDILQSIPATLLGIVIVSALGQGIGNLVIAIGVAYIAGVASTTRAAVMTVKNSEYVEAARMVGMKEWQIIAHHIIPNCFSPILVRVTLQVASGIVAASSLSFLGIGVPVPSPEWGALLSAGRGLIRQASYLTIFPGLAIMITVLSLNLLGDGLRDAMDPKLRK